MNAVPSDLTVALPHRERPGARRLRPAQAVAAVSVVGLLVWLLVAPPDLGRITVPTVTSWWWAAAAVAACAVSFSAAAAVVHGVSPVRIRPGVVTATQLGAAATRLVSPASAGVVGLNARLLNRHGAPLPAAVGAVAGSQLAQLAVTVGALVAVVPAAGRGLPISWPVSPWWVSGAGAVVATVVAALLCTKRATAFRGQLRHAVRPLGDAVRSPARTALVLSGSLGLTAALTVSLWASVRALGGTASLLPVGIVLLVGSALGSTVPTPGGVGGVEGAMVAGLVATGLSADVAVPAVLLFRLVTFWLPMPLGAVALVWLRRAGHL